MAEAGVPDMEVPVWDGVLRPRGDAAGDRRPPAKGSRAGGADPEVKERFAAMGLERSAARRGPRRQVARDIEKWTAVARAANIKND